MGNFFRAPADLKNYFEVNHIIDDRFVEGRREYLVRWEDSWVKDTNCDQLISEYEARKKEEAERKVFVILIIMGRKLVTLLDRLHPKQLAVEKRAAREEVAIEAVKEAPTPKSLQIADKVMYRVSLGRPNEYTWLPAIVTKILGPRRVKIKNPEGVTLTRHIDHIKPVASQPTDSPELPAVALNEDEGEPILHQAPASPPRPVAPSPVRRPLAAPPAVPVPPSPARLAVPVPPSPARPAAPVPPSPARPAAPVPPSPARPAAKTPRPQRVASRPARYRQD